MNRDYNSEIKALRDKHNTIREQEMELFADTTLLLDILTNNKSDNIGWEFLNSLPQDDWFEIKKGILSKMHSKTKNSISFITKMDAGSTFGRHRHDDCNEEPKVIKGYMYDAELKTRIGEGESFIYPAGLVHAPMAIKNSEILFTFTKI